jgi:hypothetical protein
LGKATRNMVPGSTWVTVPVSPIGSSFATNQGSAGQPGHGLLLDDSPSLEGPTTAGQCLVRGSKASTFCGSNSDYGLLGVPASTGSRAKPAEAGTPNGAQARAGHQDENCWFCGLKTGRPLTSWTACRGRHRRHKPGHLEVVG